MLARRHPRRTPPARLALPTLALPLVCLTGAPRLAWASPRAGDPQPPGRTSGPADGTPPRMDGWYLGAATLGSVAWARVNDLPTPRPFLGSSGALRVGQVVLPWLALGLELWGGMSFARPPAGRQRLGQGGLLVNLTAIPVRGRGLTMTLGFGIAGGAVRQQGVSGRAGFGGPLFAGRLGYEFFPTAARRRPHRAGGWAIGPELGAYVATPAAAGRPMAATVILGLRTTFFFGD